MTAWQARAVRALDGGEASLDTNPDARIRIAMIDGVAAAGIDQHVRRIVLRLADADGRVRAAALMALAWSGSCSTG